LPEHLRTILRDLGLAIHVPGLMAFVTLPIGLAAGEWETLVPFLATGLLAIGLGQTLFRAFRRAGAMQMRHAMDTAALAWLVVPLFGALPFLLVALATPEDALSPSLGHFRSPLDAVFEGVSGFTSSGLTMTLDPAELPASLQWWRSFMQWVGGVGVIVLLLTVLDPSGDAERLYFAEARERTIRPDLLATVRTIWWIYGLYPGLAILGLWLAGMPIWHALNYGMAAIATGGFGSSSGGAADFGTAPCLVLIVIIAVGAISFATHDRMLTKRRGALFWRDPETRALLAVLGLGALLLLLENRSASGTWLWLDSAFQWASASSTAGFQIVDLGTWSVTAHMLLIAAMICGGASGSTAGGFKLHRVVLVTGGALRRIARVVRQPWRLAGHKALGDPREARRQLEAATTLLAIWLATLMAGTLLLLHVLGPDARLDAVLLEAASALGNVGLSSGIANPDLPWGGKVTLIGLMWVGRLEIVPALVLLANLVPSRGRHNG
jgi:trk system potassium uptake protein TrkH